MVRLVAALCLAFSVAACATRIVPGAGWVPPSPIDPLRSAIYYARLDEVEQQPGNYTVVDSETFALCETHGDWPVKGCKTGNWLHLLPPDSLYHPLLQVLLKENMAFAPIDLANTGSVKVFTGREIEEGFGRKHSWQRFYKRFPGGRGILRFSRPAISPDGTKAVLVEDLVAGEDLGGGALIMLAREGASGTWKIIDQQMLWIY